MNWLNLSVSIATSPEYIGAEPTQRGTWFSLIAYCALQENGGILPSCREWKDRRWQQTAGVTAEEIEATCDLYWFDGDDLHVAFYPTSKQKQVESGRTGGHLGGRPKNPSKNPSQNPSKGEGITLEKEKGKAPPKPEDKIREEKIREEREENPASPPPLAPAPQPVVRPGNLMDQLTAQVNSLRPEWARLHRLTGSEMHALHDAAGTLECLTDADWDLIRRYLFARIPEGKPKWQPTSRAKFLEAPADVLTHAESWQRAQRPPGTSEGQKIVPIAPRPVIPRSELAEIFSPKTA